MKKLNLVFLWHMHQPYYKDNVIDEYLMPWVFLHAIKDYYELLWLHETHGIKAIFNLVPSLIVQLEDYSTNLGKDKLLKVMMKDPATLSAGELGVIDEYCFSANKERMILPFARYYELYQKRGNYFSPQDILDLEVLFILAWCGNYLRQNDKTVMELIQKGQNYSLADKERLFLALQSFLKTILAKYKSLQEAGLISVFTTPFYHPITPILLDPRSTKEANSKTPVAETGAMSDDALFHTKEAVALYEKTFGCAPKGFWPAEGALSQAALELFSANGISYVCSDEELLFKSVQNLKRQDLYKPYRVNFNGKDVFLLFRDKALSDLIGFTYSNMPAQDAVNNFIDNLKKIYYGSGFNPIVSVFLDGENAWEYYQNNGYDFFNALFARLNQEDFIQTNHIGGLDLSYADEIKSFKPGSWINGCFDTWMGHREKNIAWERLFNTYKDYKTFENLSLEQRQKIEEEIHIAQGSDWFWWYGDDHYTPLAGEFDAGFRKHLQNVYYIAQKEIPSVLFEPIKKLSKAALVKDSLPTMFINPLIDGKKNIYYEWLGAGKVYLNSDYSVMDSSADFIELLEYGTNAREVFLKITPKLPLKGKTFEIHILQEKQRLLSLDLGLEFFSGEGYRYAYADFLEVAIDKEIFNIGSLLQMYFSIKAQDLFLQRVPLYKELSLDLNSGYDAVWYI